MPKQKIPKTDSRSILDNLRLSYSCPVDWDTMTGDDRERFCSKCTKKVYNISDMTRCEAEQFLQERVANGPLPCINFYIRSDGTIKTSNCPRVFRSFMDTMLKVLKPGFVCFSLLFAGLATNSAKAENRNRRAGFAMVPNIYARTEYPGSLNPSCPEYKEESENLSRLRSQLYKNGCPVFSFSNAINADANSLLAKHKSEKKDSHSDSESRDQALKYILNLSNTKNDFSAYALITEFMNIATVDSDRQGLLRKSPPRVYLPKIISGQWKGRIFFGDIQLLEKFYKSVSKRKGSKSSEAYKAELRQIMHDVRKH